MCLGDIMKMKETNWDEVLYVCCSCNQDAELKTGYGSEEVCYGHGRISTENYEYEATECCGSDYHRISLSEYSYDEPFEAYEGGWIEKDELIVILTWVKNECEDTFNNLVDAWLFKYGGRDDERSLVGKV